jgi:hypothetical protein|nr:MAG TPA: hypothetical protein [Caudoviricetes sp.]
MTNEELEQEVKRLEEQITNLRIKFLESNANKKPYEVEVPDDINHLAYLDEDGYCIPLEDYDYKNKKNIYFRGLAFETREEAEKYDKERILLFKLHKWAEEHNGGWTPNWNDTDEEKYTVRYDYSDNQLETFYSYSYKEFSKLPYFISDDTAQQFIEEFGEEIKEVLC